MVQKAQVETVVGCRRTLSSRRSRPARLSQPNFGVDARRGRPEVSGPEIVTPVRPIHVASHIVRPRGRHDYFVNGG